MATEVKVKENESLDSALKRFKRPAQQPGLLVPLDGTFGDHATRDVAELGGTEDFANLGLSAKVLTSNIW